MSSGVASGSSGLTSGLVGSLKNKAISGVKGKAKDKMLGLLQKVIDRYMNEACTNPTAFIQKVLDDMKSSTLFPSAVRITLEEQRADVEAAIGEVIKTPQMQKACQSKDANTIAQLIMDVMQGKIDLDGTGTATANAPVNNTGTATANAPVNNTGTATANNAGMAATPNEPANATGTAPANGNVTGGRRRRSHKRQARHRRKSSYRRSRK
jgi:hypothetical protein